MSYKMKLFVVGSLFLSVGAVDAFGACATSSIEGQYKNKRGHLFQVVQPDCEHLILMDLKNGVTINVDFNNPANPLIVKGNSLPSVISRSVPLTVSMKKTPTPDVNSLRFDGGMEQIFTAYSAYTIDVSAKLRIKQSDHSLGIRSPRLTVKFAIWANREVDWSKPNAQSDLSSQPKEIVIYPVKIGVDEDPNSSAVQRAFVRGMNFGLNLLFKHVGDEGLVEVLTAVK